jgi:hypothetical protein
VLGLGLFSGLEILSPIFVSRFFMRVNDMTRRYSQCRIDSDSPYKIDARLPGWDLFPPFPSLSLSLSDFQKWGSGN